MYLIGKWRLRILREPSKYNSITQIEHLKGMIVYSDIACIKQLRIDKHTLYVFCSMLKDIRGA